jgi:hypothetical protein
MRKLYTLAASLLLFTQAKAQIPNGSFENWTDGVPNGWVTFNIAGFNMVNESSDAYAGSKAVRLNVIDFFGLTSGGFLATGTIDNPFINTSQTGNKVTFWYKFNNGANDILTCFAGTTSVGSSDTLEAGNVFSTTTNVYTQGVVNLPSQSFNQIAVGFFITPLDTTAGNMPSANTFALIDDVKIETGVSLADVNSFEFFESVYPNPSSQIANVVYSINSASNVIIRTIDLNGRIIETQNLGKQGSGRYRVELDTRNYSNGIYFVEVQVNDSVAKQKLVVAH